jgi:predicted NUDIX family phosphoesterase
MSTQQTVSSNTSTLSAKYQERILVVKREYLFSPDQPVGFYQGVVRQNISRYEALIRRHAEFLPRGLMENDETYRQIIPYLVFTNQDRLFLMQRSAQANEARLANKYSIGIGGHVREQDLRDGDIAAWGKREFAEEINYKGRLSMTPIGVLNDDSNAVGRVHTGIVYLLHGDSDEISVKTELQSGKLMTCEQCEEYYDQMENWSQLMFDALKQARYI